MKMNAFAKLTAFALVAGAFAAGCVVTTNDDGDGGAGAGGSGNSSGSGGSGNSAGTGATGGTGATAGTGGSAGTGGGAVTCDPNTTAGDCQKCLETACCTEYLACNAVSGCIEKVSAYNACLKAKGDASQGIGVTDADKQACGNEQGIFSLGEANDLVVCADPGLGTTDDAGVQLGCYKIDNGNTYNVCYGY